MVVTKWKKLQMVFVCILISHAALFIFKKKNVSTNLQSVFMCSFDLSILLLYTYNKLVAISSHHNRDTTLATFLLLLGLSRTFCCALYCDYNLRHKIQATCTFLIKNVTFLGFTNGHKKSGDLNCTMSQRWKLYKLVKRCQQLFSFFSPFFLYFLLLLLLAFFFSF